MKGEPPMTIEHLVRTIGIFSALVLLVVVAGFYLFIRWSKSERSKRGGQIALARLDPEFADLESRRQRDDGSS